MKHKDNPKLTAFQNYAFNITAYITYVLLTLSFIGISENAKSVLNTVDYYLKIYVCLFLIWRFNPFYTLENFTDLDRKIAFTSGIFLITTTALNTYIVDIKSFMLYIKNTYF